MQEQQTYQNGESPNEVSQESQQIPDTPVELPLGVRVAAAWSWRLIVIGLAVAAFVWLIVQVRIIVVPLVVALLLSALLHPIIHFFERRSWPRSLGVLTALLALTVAVGTLFWLIVSQLRSGFGDFARRSEQSWFDFLNWIESAPFGFSAEQIDGFADQLWQTIETHQDEIWSGALAATTTAGQFVAGLLLTIFSLIFLLIDGKRIWYWVVGFLPKRVQEPVDHAGRYGWESVGQYTRVQVFVALIDAVGIGLGAVLLGVPLAIPISILVFFGSFIPFLGAITTGAFAAFIALVYNGPVNALVMLGVVILVNQLEGHVLQPLVIGNAVRVHPLGVVLAVSTGALLAGIPGALFAVPLVAAASAMINAFVRQEWDPTADSVGKFHRDRQRDSIVRTRARSVSKLQRKGASE